MKPRTPEDSSEEISCAPPQAKRAKNRSSDHKNNDKSEIVSVLSDSENDGEEVKMMIVTEGGPESDHNNLSDQKQSPKAF